jgi:hypothetical protein
MRPISGPMVLDAFGKAFPGGLNAASGGHSSLQGL